MEIEKMLYDTVMSMFGSPILVGIFVFAFFLFLGIVLKLRGMALVIVMFLALVIDMSFIPEFRIIAGIGMGIIIGLAALKLVRR